MCYVLHSTSTVLNGVYVPQSIMTARCVFYRVQVLCGVCFSTEDKDCMMCVLHSTHTVLNGVYVPQSTAKTDVCCIEYKDCV